MECFRNRERLRLRHLLRPVIRLSMSAILGLTAVSAATISECQELLRTGKYTECLDATTEAIGKRSYGEDWPILKASAETRLGRYLQAEQTIDAGTTRYSWSIRLRMQNFRICQLLGETEKAQQMIDEINRLATSAPWRYTDADDLVALGQAAIVMGADPKDVLEGFFDRARKNYASRSDGYLAAGQLAIDKGDLQLAASILRPAADKFPNEPEICFALATAVQSGAPQEAASLLEHSLTVNPSFLPAMQRLAENRIDAEQYAAATSIIRDIHAINPRHPQAHALQAVIHHLATDSLKEAESRSRAMEFSAAIPEVDHMIGQKLSRKYRFLEGARYQRMALAADPLFLPARMQLAQDLLRLGDEIQGWKLAGEAQKQDKYDVTLFNLMQLKNSVDNFATRQTDRFVIRMEKSESEVYGAQVESLLSEAFDTLSQKYGHVPEEPVIVEIFHRPDDFAVRTFGMPDVAGFLGVCFGNVITANSPASMRSSPNNWRSVLWHEFCHVITLQMTGNRIPRWLSEGISVYEERQRDTRWGQSMDPVSRRRVQSGNVTPVSQLSSAFLKAQSGEDLNFAYYQSSMVVEFIVEEHGFDALKSILGDLKRGFTINDALERHTGGLKELDATFDKYIQEVAASFAKDVQFQVERVQGAPPPDLLEIAADNPRHYTAGLAAAVAHIRAKEYDVAQQKLTALIELYPEDTSANGARRLLAEVYKRLNRTSDQVRILSDHLQRSGSDLEAASELLALQVTAEQWDAALAAGALVLAIDPLQPESLRLILKAAQAASREDLAMQTLHALLELDPADAARTHFQIATILRDTDPASARRHVLFALERAPRYRAAHTLLLSLPASPSPAP